MVLSINPVPRYRVKQPNRHLPSKLEPFRHAKGQPLYEFVRICVRKNPASKKDGYIGHQILFTALTRHHGHLGPIHLIERKLWLADAARILVIPEGHHERAVAFSVTSVPSVEQLYKSAKR